MREHKRAAIPSGDLISLGSKSKKVSVSQGNPTKKARVQAAEGTGVYVDSSELVTRVEAALSANDSNLVESLIIAALNQLKTSSGHGVLSSPLSSGSDFRPAHSGSGSRLLPGVSLGLLILAQNHPNMFTRPAILDQLILILSLSPRELGISLPSAAITTIIPRIRGLHVLIANILCLALGPQVKWPSKLVKVYLEDSLANRLWVDQDECRLFVLNLETAFPKTFGDPRGLFSILSVNQNGSTGSSQPGSSINYSLNASLANPVFSVLGISGVQSSLGSESPGPASIHCDRDEISEAISNVLKNQSSSVSTSIFGSDMSSHVSPRFDACRQAVEVIIINTLRDALGRRSGAIPSTSQTVTTNSSNTSASVISVPPATSVTCGDAAQLKNLLRTLGMATGISEIRGLVAAKLEPWLTNPKLQLYGLGLFALVATNCRLGGLSPHDLDFMISSVYRIRYKLLKPHIQTAFLECVSHLVKAAPMNLYCIVNLSSAAPELRFVSNASEPGYSNQNLSSVVLKISETVQALSTEGGCQISQHNNMNSAAIAAVAANASSASSRGASSAGILLPFLYQRFGSHWVRIIGDLLSERLILASLDTTNQASQNSLTDSQLFDELNTRLSPNYQFLRELARFTRSDNDRLTGSAALTSQSSLFQSQQNYLPCSELAFALLQDRSFRGAASTSTVVNAVVVSLTQQRDQSHGKSTVESSKSDISVFQCYLRGLISLVCVLQMLSANRPFLSNSSSSTTPNSRQTSSYAEAVKTHHLTLRQIRLAFVRWMKSLLPMFINAASQNCSIPFIKCLEIIKPVNLIRQAFVLDSITPLNDSQSENHYQLSSGLYPRQDIWPDQDHNLLTRLVCDTGVSEKVLNQLLILGLDTSYQFLTAVQAGDIVCDLIWRGCMLSCDSGLESLNVTKPEQLIDLLFASCTYLPNQQVPAEMNELAYAQLYWKVTLTCIVLAAYCPRTCGSYLWSNFPTVRRLMEIVISSDFVNCSSFESTSHSQCVEVTEKMSSEIEIQMIIRLESFLLSSENKITSATSNSEENHPFTSDSVVIVTPESSQLIHKLVRNNPRGPCRRLPEEQLCYLHFLCQRLHLDRRLWSSRNPDFLIDLLRSQASSVVAQPWLMRLIESTREDLDVLPVQCLCEYLLYGAMVRAQDIKIDWSHISRTVVQSVNTDIFDNLCAFQSEKIKLNDNNKLISHLVAKLRESLTQDSFDVSVSDAFTHSFFSRLCDSRLVVRQAARQCIRSLVPETVDTSLNQQLTDIACRWLYILKFLDQLPANDKSFSSTTYPLKESTHQLTGPLLTSFQVENDLDILTANLLFLSQIIHSPNFTLWQPLVTALSQFILTRPTILSSLLHRDALHCHDPYDLLSKTAYKALEAMSEIFTCYVNHCCTVTEAIPIMEKKSVFVSWSPDCQYPFDIEFIQAQILLLTHLNADLPETNSICGESSWWTRLRNTWFLANNDGNISNDNVSYCMPEMSPLSSLDNMMDASGKQTEQQIWFTFSSCDSVPQLKFSVGLRSRLIQTNQIPLVFGAFFNITSLEVAELIKSVPQFILNENTIKVFSEQVCSISSDLLDKDIPRKFRKPIDEVCYTKCPSTMDVDSPEELLVTIPSFNRIKIDSCINLPKIESIIKENVVGEEIVISNKIVSAIHPTTPDMDAFETYGLYELVNILPNNVQSLLINPILLGEDIQHDSVLCTIHRLVFEHDQFYENYIKNLNLFNLGGNHNFFLTELLNQANPTFLNKSVSILLKYNETERIRPTNSLDFITALFTLPRLAYPVPRAEPRDRPDPSVALTSIYRLTLTEACKLIEYILMEAHKLIRLHENERNLDWDVLNHLYTERTPLLDTAVVQWSKSCILLLEIISGLINICDTNDQHTFDINLLNSMIKNSYIVKRLKSDELWSILAFRLILFLYFRRPGVSNLFHADVTRQLVCHPCPVIKTSSNVHTLMEKFGLVNLKNSNFAQPEIDRVGPIILVSLTSSNVSIMDTAQLACKALITQHTRTCLRLLPIICCLSEGRLSMTWTQFMNKRYHILFSNLLHILEILSTTSIDCTAETLLDVYAGNGSVLSVKNSALFSREVLPYSCSFSLFSWAYSSP
ncbi:Integrator complex subunit 1 [Schistosoma japonicum]|nr:Integrator complex subunit 1 [Schistosoma japonicum]